MLVTTIVSAVFGLLYVRLALGVVKLRHKHRVSVGYGDHDDLHLAIRAQGNLAEYAPIILILLACLEFNGAPLVLTGFLGITVIAGRLLHAQGITRPPEVPMKFRVLGMQLTLWPIIILSIANLLWLVWTLIR